MKKNIFILLLLIPFIGLSQMRERFKSTDWEKYELKGKVKEVLHKEYIPRFSNDTTYTLELYDIVLALLNYKLEFNKTGNLNTLTELKLEDSLIASVVWNYKYNSKNRIVQEKRVSLQYSKDTIIWNYQYKGNSITNIQQLDKTYKILYYTYKQKGNVEYLSQTNSDSSYIGKRVFVYDKKNRLIRDEDYENQKTIQHLTVSTYKDNGSNKKHRDTITSIKYNYRLYNEFEYNEYGDIIIMKTGSFTDAPSSVNKYTYVYDKKGNWIEKKI